MLCEGSITKLMQRRIESAEEYANGARDDRQLKAIRSMMRSAAMQMSEASAFANALGNWRLSAALSTAAICAGKSATATRRIDATCERLAFYRTLEHVKTTLTKGV